MVWKMWEEWAHSSALQLPTYNYDQVNMNYKYVMYKCLRAYLKCDELAIEHPIQAC